jgi:DNA-binding GntR family transcriptional regulator
MRATSAIRPGCEEEPALGTQSNSRGLTRNPKYVSIRNVLRNRILAGRYGLGSRLPSESALMSQFAVSRVTVRLALEALREVGLVESRQGKGHFVRPVRAIQDLGRLQGFGEMMAVVDVEACSTVLSVAETPASAEVAKALHVERGVPVIAIHRVRIGGGTPTMSVISRSISDAGLLAKISPMSTSSPCWSASSRSIWRTPICNWKSPGPTRPSLRICA